MKRKTLIALAVASLFAAPLAYADSDTDKTREGSLITASSPDADQGQREMRDLIRLPYSVIMAEGEDKEKSEKSDLIADGEEKKDGESTQVIAEGEDKEKGEKADLIADGEEKKEGESSQLIA
ncbi:MAG TPA: hypothetical protein VD839_07305 [Burkholderiales bacterium]|nr:hypothetical protein [Burkholderiales bacterium]